MKISGAAVLLVALGVPALAQQSPTAGGGGVTLPVVQAAGGLQGTGAGDRPGGISHVTRQRSTAGNILVTNSFFAAGGVRVVTAAGPAGAASVSQSATPVAAAAGPTSRLPAASIVLDARSRAALQRLAASGNPDAQRILAGAARGGR